MIFFYDTYAIMCLIEGDKNYEQYKDNIITTSIFNLAELYNIFLKREIHKQGGKYAQSSSNYLINMCSFYVFL